MNLPFTTKIIKRKLSEKPLVIQDTPVVPLADTTKAPLWGAGDLILHPTYGDGIIKRVEAPNASCIFGKALRVVPISDLVHLGSHDE